MPFLSIIVPVYNVEQYLRQCLDSILSQTFEDFELIIVDDGSPDSCPQICDEYAELDSRVKVIHKENSGQVSARKTGLSIASGEYVDYVDSDDWIESDMYELLCGAARKYQADIILCDYYMSLKDKEIKVKHAIKPGFYDKKSMEKSVYPFMLYSGEFYQFGIKPEVWNKIFRREILEKNQYKIDDAIRYGEDVACTYPCMLDANSIYVLPNKYLYHYRKHQSSITGSYDDRLIERILLLNKHFKNMIIEKKFDLSSQLYYFLSYLVIVGVENELRIENKISFKVKCRNIYQFLLNDDVNKALKNISVNGFRFKYKIYIWLLRRRQVFILCNFILWYPKLVKYLYKYRNV